jgi:hypothetical protein
MYPTPGVMANAWIKFFQNNHTNLEAITNTTYITQVAQTVNATTTISSETFITICDSLSDFVLNLPQANTMTNKFFIIYNKGMGTVLVSPYRMEKISDSTNFSLRQWESIPVISDGFNWYIF